MALTRMRHNDNWLPRTALVGLLASVLAACAPQPATPVLPVSTPLAVPAASTPAASPTPKPAPGMPAAGLAGLGDPLYPQLGNTGYDVQHYTIDLDVDIARNTISGTTTIVAHATQDLPTFHLDLSGLELRSVFVNQAPAHFTRAGSELIITPTDALSNSLPFSVTVDYAGTPEPIRDPGVPFVPLGWLQQENGSFVVSEPSGAMNWYPVNNHPADKATYTFHITVPDPYQVAANGILVGTVDHGDTTTYSWEMRDPMASYLATVHVGEYTVEEQTGPGGLLIRNYFPIDTPAAVKASFAATADMITFMEQLIGPYPFDAYGVVLLNENTGWALETQTLSTFGRQGADEGTIFHELMHQWFGNHVSPATWRDVWLNEGFATYFSLLWTERTAGRTATDATMASWYRRMAAEDTGPPIPVTPAEMFSPAVYQRGAWTLHALRLAVGDERFFDILRTYYLRHAGGNATTQDFIDVAVAVGGSEVGSLLRAWLDDAEVPEVRF